MLVDSHGRQIALGKRIAQGGEGEVYCVVSANETVAKLYHGSPSAEKVAKLSAMTSGTSAELAKLTCWPSEILREGSTGKVKGFLMPSAAGSKEVHLLYSPKSRASEFASVQWQFLIAAAANMARAFAMVHNHGHVIGDVNHSSVMIATNATVRLIDCDSFQIRNGNRLFRCEVGEPGHTPPELQRMNLANVDRTPTHDNFGLAVLVFELLFMGRHPFAGQFLGPEDLGLEDKIGRFLFAYGPEAGRRQMKQPPNTLSLDAVTPKVAALFEASFSSKGPISRPSAAEWASALDDLRSQTKQCSIERGHFYFRGLATCPWCPLEAKFGFSLFTVLFAPAPTNPGFDLALIWNSIQGVPKPIPVARLPLPVEVSPGSPHEKFKVAGVSRKKRIGALSVSGSLLIGLSLVNLGYAALPLVIFVSVLAYCLKSRMGWLSLRDEAKLRVDSLIREYDTARSAYEHWVDGHLFKEAILDLEAKRQALIGLPALKESKLAQLRSEARAVLLKQFLNQQQIRPGVVSGIGLSRCADLQAYNVDTAADIEWDKILRVPGIGETRAAKLMAWRLSMEAKFRFNPQAINHTPNYKRIQSELGHLQAQLELALMGGEKMLKDINAKSTAQRHQLEPKVKRNLEGLTEALADLKAL